MDTELLNMDAPVILKNRGLKVTKIRVAILKAMGESRQALPYSELQKKLSIFDRTTLYRTLLVMIDKGFIHKALEENGDTYYALCSSCTSKVHNHNHVHFKCKECSSVQCLYLQNEIGLSIPEISIETIEITAKGTCSLCRLTN